MDKESLKRKLHAQIDAMDDEMALQMLHEAVLAYANPKDIPEELTPEQLARFEKAFAQAEKGNTISHEEAMKRLKEWRTQ